jgi:SAM-dependent methyltransferase
MSPLPQLPHHPLDAYLGIVDVRPGDIFVRAHLREATSIPANELSSSMFLFPERPFLLTRDVRADTATMLAADAGQTILLVLRPCDIPVLLAGGKPLSRPLPPTNIDDPDLQALFVLFATRGFPVDFLFCSEELPGSVPPELVTSGPQSRQLWKPLPFIIDTADRLLRSAATHGDPRPRAADLGAGGGRNAVALALQGWHVVAVDNRAAVLVTAKKLAVASGVDEDAAEFVNVNLKDTAVFPGSQLPAGEFDLVVMARFWLPPVHRAVARLLAPSGALLIHHFSEGALSFGRPSKPSLVATEAEIQKFLTPLPDGFGLELVSRRDETLPDGRPLVNLHLRRPASAACDSDGNV